MVEEVVKSQQQELKELREANVLLQNSVEELNVRLATWDDWYEKAVAIETELRAELDQMHEKFNGEFYEYLRLTSCYFS